MKHVFVSSTFKDMQFERDALHRFSELNLNAALASYGESVYFGDLRWGVNTTALDSEDGSRRVLEVCLDEIDDCRPYMIVLIGERYGWIPDGSLLRDAAAAKGIELADEMSVTQLEIEYGALLSPENKGRVFFYFRELDTSGMTEEELSDYTSESALHRERIEALKERICAIYPDSVRTYTARWSSKAHSVVGLEGFIDMVNTDLGAAFLSDLEEEESLPWQERAIRSAERYYLEIAKGYHPIPREPISMFDGTFAAKRTLMRFIKGRSGSGKTAFLASSFRAAYEKHSRCELLPFVLGLDKYSTCEMDYFKILLYKIEELSGLSHYETGYGDPTYDKAVFDNIFSYEGIVDGMVHSFIDNCSYELQNKLSTHVLDLHIRRRDVEYFGNEECSHDHLDFMISYSADDEAVILAPWFDYSRTYVLDTVEEEEQIPLIKTLLRQKHKELSDEVISAIAEKEEASYPFYLKLVVDRMLMQGSEDFAAIRAMGDGMESINRYQLSLISSLPGDTAGVAKELIGIVAARVNPELVMRVIGLLVYSSIRMDEGDITGVFSTRGWDYNSLDFALATRSLSAILNYNPKDKSYAITNPDVILAAEELLEAQGYGYVARSLYDHIICIGGGAIADALFRAASYVGGDFLAEFYVKQHKNKAALSAETDWLIKRRGAEFTAEILTRVATNNPDIDFSFIIQAIPTACLTYEDREPYELLLQTILDNFHTSRNEFNDVSRNTIAAVAWCKLVLMKMKVNTADAAPLFHEFVDKGYHDYMMTVPARVLCDVIYYRFLALEAFYSMKIIDAESTLPSCHDLLERLGDSNEAFLLTTHLFASFALYLERAFEPEAATYRNLSKRGYKALAEILADGGEDCFTADDVALMIDSTLDDRDEVLRVEYSDISSAIGCMAIGQTHIDSRLNKYLPRILAASKHSFDDPEDAELGNGVYVYKRLVATSRAVAGSSLTLDDFIYATVQMEHSVDPLLDDLSPEELFDLLSHLDRFVRISLNNSDKQPRVLYRCYNAMRKLLFLFNNFDMNGAKSRLVSFISSLEFEDSEAPVLPELFLGSLVFCYGNPENYELRDYLRGLYNTVESEEGYMAVASAYSPELMYIKIDLRTPEEIEEDDNYFSYSDDESDGFDEYSSGEYDDFDDLDGYDDSDELDDYDDSDELDGSDDSEDSDGDSDFSYDELVAMLGEMGISPDDLFPDIDDIVSDGADGD